MAPYVTGGMDWARWGGAWLVRFETLFRPFAWLRAFATQIVPPARFAEPSARRCLPSTKTYPCNNLPLRLMQNIGQAMWNKCFSGD
jgi:hypothetical protein